MPRSLLTLSLVRTDSRQGGGSVSYLCVSAEYEEVILALEDSERSLLLVASHVTAAMWCEMSVEEWPF